MSSNRRGPAIATTLANAVREIRRAVRSAVAARPPGLARLRDTGWQLTQLTAELTDLTALLADNTGYHIEHAEHARLADGRPAGEHLARACRELATLRHRLDQAHAAARDYYTAISLANPAAEPGLPPRSP